MFLFVLGGSFLLPLSLCAVTSLPGNAKYYPLLLNNNFDFLQKPICVENWGPEVTCTKHYLPNEEPTQHHIERPEILPEEMMPDPTHEVEEEDDNNNYESIVNEEDGRRYITNPTKPQYRLFSKLHLTFPNGKKCGGSGTLISSSHLLTAAHNVFNKKVGGHVTDISVIPAMADGQAPYGEIKGIGYYIHDDWVDADWEQKGKPEPEFDIALVVLDRPIGDVVGYSGIAACGDATLQGRFVKLVGYPGDKGGKQMWKMSNSFKNITPTRLFYDIDTYDGQSGSGIRFNDKGFPFNKYLIGVHTNGQARRGAKTGNKGVRISNNKFDMLVNWLTHSGEVKPKTVSSTAGEPMEVDKSINLKSQNIGVREARYINTLLLSKSLTNELHLHDNVLKNDGIKTIIPGLSGITALTHLDLSSNQIGDSGATSLAPALQNMKVLSWFNLGNNKIGNLGISNIALNLNTDRLTYLDLHGNRQIGDEGIKELTTALQKSAHSLKTLELFDTRIGNLGANYIASLIRETPNINRVGLYRTSIGPNGKNILAQAMGDKSNSLLLDN